MGALEQRCRSQVQGTAGAQVVVDEQPGPCPYCAGPMHVEKTFQHHGITIEHGPFEARETVYVCAARCRLSGRLVRWRQPELAELLLPRSTSGYDLMVLVGLRRFVDHRQREEIRAELQSRHGISLSAGELSALGRRFLLYLEALHQAQAQPLRAALAKDGGFPLHIDATGEDGRGTLLVAYAGWRQWVLGAWKIPTERAEAILPRLQLLVERFGSPCAVMRDLGRAVIDAARDLVASLGRPIPVLGCHLHFLKDVGEDLLTEAHDELRALFRRFETTGHLRALARDLGRRLGPSLEPIRQRVSAWLAAPADNHDLPQGLAGLAVVRALAQWVLDYPHDGRDEGFPFDLPQLDLYRRCRRACRAVEAYLWTLGDDRKVHQALLRMHRILEPVRSELPFQKPAATLEARGRLLTELREALRLKVKPPPDLGPAPSTPKAEQELRDIETALDDLARSLRKRRPAAGPAKSTRQAIDLILAHLERHGPSLCGHAIALPQSAGGGIRLVERTNVLLEAFFHRLKHGERRRSGRKILTHDLEQLPPAAALAFNLTRSDYVEILCGSLEQLPRAFATLDTADRSRSLPARTRAQIAELQDHDIVSRSMPTADRKIIRAEAMETRLQAALRSRPPRWGR